MKRNVWTGIVLTAVMLLMNPAKAGAHTYGANGVCTEAGCTSPYQEPTLQDGWYLLENAGHVEWFAARVNGGGNDIFLKGRLVADIDFTGVKHTPIGVSEATKFNGQFDGQGHRILNLKMNASTSDLQGFFGGLRGGGTVVRNLILDKSCAIRGRQRVGGIAAFIQTIVDGAIVIENCVNEANITGSSTAVGGILGGSMSPHPAIHIVNCMNAGRVTGSGESATIAGWLGDNAGSYVMNCFNMGTLSGMDADKRNIARCGGAAQVLNVYDMKPASGALQGTKKSWNTTAPLTSGELCFRLNGTPDVHQWRQTLGEDAHPWPFSSSQQVYLSGQVTCDGGIVAGVTAFTNTDGLQQRDSHDFHRGFCSVCGEEDAAYHPTSPRKVFLMAGQSNADGRSPVSTMPQYIQDYVSRGGSRFCHWSYANGTDAAWEMFGGKMQPYMPYTDNNTTARCGFDGILYHLIEEQLGERFYVIKESRGGTAIDPRCNSTGNLYWCAAPDWLQTASPRSGHSLALEFTENIGLCIDNVLSHLEEGYEIECILWHQGEADRTQPDAYEANLRQLVAYLRSFLVEKTGQQRYATLPFITGTVNRNSTQYNAGVEAAIYRLEEQDPNFHVVDMSNCKLGSDVLHFDAVGCQDAASRMLKKLNALGLLEQEPEDETALPRTESIALPTCSDVYDLSGRIIARKAKNLKRGLYVVNHRKMVVGE